MQDPRIVLFAFCICTLFWACKKDKQELPATTSKGANTFGCLLNGEPIIFTNPKQISYGLVSDYDSLGVLSYDSADMWLVFENGKHIVNLFLNNPIFNTIWLLTKNTNIHPVVVSPEDYIMIDGFISSEGTQGFFKSNDLNATKPIFSGTFEFECINPRTRQTMKVTNGRLDVNLNQLQ